jgi:hypothetical protein
MKICANRIEEWLLSGKAILKNLACGNAGLTQIPVPEGKTFIITKIEILPFVNIITDSNVFAQATTFYDVLQQSIDKIIGRSQLQLLFYNERINNTYNLRNKFSINTYEGTDTNTHTAPSITYEKQEIDTFLVVESNSWLYLKYIDFLTSPYTLYQDTYPNIFNGSQNWSPSPYFGYSDQNDIANVANSAGASFDYVPQGYNTNYGTPEFNSDQFILPNLDTISDPNQNSSFIPPYSLAGATSGPINLRNLFSLPLYNIEYIEVNRRLSTNGLL